MSLTWQVTESESPSSLVKTGCADASVTTDQGPADYSCAATSAGGSAGPVIVTLKRDTTPPTITFVGRTLANASGWNNGDVVVTWACADSGSGVVSATVSQTVSAEGAGLSVTGTCADQAGNTATNTASGINIDRTAPTNVVGTAERAPDNNGWYNHAVGISFAGQDTLSGIASCTSTSYSGPDSATAAATGTCTDNAGNVGTGSFGLQYDGTGPSATLAVTAGTLGANGWYTSDVAVATTGGDDTSGPVSCTDVQALTSETTGQSFSGSCINAAGLRTDAAPLTVKLDKTGPSAALTVTSGTLGANGWYTSDITVATMGDDDVSSPVNCTVVQSLTTDSAGTQTEGSCTNDAGLSTAAEPLTVKRDATAPINVVGTASRTPDNNGWYNHAVGISFAGQDTLSGIASCSSTSYSGPDSATAAATGTCTDNAGNVGTGSFGLQYDGSGPSATLAVTAGTPGANGWYTSDVTVSTTGDDDTSGPVSCTDVQALTSETTGKSFSGSCTNAAGLITTAAPLTVKLDKTGPSASLSATGTLGTNSWYTSDVAISTSGLDSISSPVSCTAIQSLTTDTAGQSFNGECTNDAGLKTTAAPLTIKRDASKPFNVVGTADRAPDSNGWYNHAVSISFTGQDALSGIASCSSASYSGPDSGTVSAAGTCTDNAGNVGTGSLALKYDATGPTLQPAVSPNPVILNGTATATPNATDLTSLVASQSCPPVNTAIAGLQSIECSATDVAGNTTKTPVSYTVGYNVCVLYDQTKSHKAGSTVPIKLQLCDVNNRNVSSASIVVTAKSLRKIDNSASTVVDDSGAANPDNNFRYDSTLGGTGGYIFNLSTKGLTTGTWQLPFTVGSATTQYTVQFDVK